MFEHCSNKTQKTFQKTGNVDNISVVEDTLNLDRFVLVKKTFLPRGSDVIYVITRFPRPLVGDSTKQFIGLCDYPLFIISWMMPSAPSA